MIVGWLGRLVLVFAVLAIVAYDAGSIIVNHVTLDSTSNDIAVAISVDAVPRRPAATTQAFEPAARDLAEEAGARLADFEVTPDGDVTVRLRRKASTLIVGRISAIADWARADAETTIRNPN